MKMSELLLGIENCECKKNHPCTIKVVEIGRGVINKLSKISENYTNILLVADENTYRVGGASVESALGDKIKDRVIFSGAELLIPNETAINTINEKITDKTDLIVGIGSGVINDLCKYTSHTANIPYHIVATAPSMDGYASRGAALILGGMKVMLDARVPEAIIADTDIFKTAPDEMILAGFGDIMGKYSCLSDWQLSTLVNGEYMCERVLSATYDEVFKVRALAGGLQRRDEAALDALMSALVAVGILMAYVGNSRPASGSEHHFSHFFEIVGIVKNENYLHHGTDVFYSAVETAKIREEILKIDSLDGFSPIFNRDKYESEIKRIYGSVADEVIALQNKLGWYEKREERLNIYREKWGEIKALLKKAPSPDEMLSILSSVDMKYSDFVDFYGEKKIKDAYLYSKDLKDRYTVLWLYSDLFM